MKRIALVVFIALMSAFSLSAYGDHPEAHFGKYGLQKYSSIAEYQNAYVGKVVKYIPTTDVSYDDKKFLERGGQFDTRYVISKISGNDEKMTFLLNEENTKNKFKFIVYNGEPAYSYGDYTFCITKDYSVPLILIDEFEADSNAIKGKEIVSEKGELIGTIIGLGLADYTEKYASSKEHPEPSYIVSGGMLSEDYHYKIADETQFKKLGKVYSSPECPVYYTVVAFEKGTGYKADWVYKLKNSETGAIVDRSPSELSLLSALGKKYTNSLVKGYYTVVDVDGSLSSIPMYVVRYSETGSDKKVEVKTAETDCFKEYISGRYVATLSKVEKPVNPATRYGKTSVVEDSGVTKFSYVDKYIDILIFAESSQFSFRLKNVSDNTIKVVWNEAVFVDSDGSTSKVMHVGTKYSEKDGDQPASTIIKGAMIDDLAAPTKNVRYSSALKEWVTDPMFPINYSKPIAPVRLMLPIQVKDVINEYVFIFDVKYRWSHPERLTFDVNDFQ